MAHDTVTALSEDDATGEIAKIFADIRHTMQIPMLTSIWRILAESEADLASTWNAVKPLYIADQPEASLARFRSNADFPHLEPITGDEIDSAGVTRNDLPAIKNILAAYNRSNSLNLLTQTAIVTDRSDTYIDYPVVESRSAIQELPHLLGRDEISDPVWQAVLDVNAYGTNTESPGLATIFRHLAYWPGLLTLMQGRLAAASEQSAISRGVTSVTEIALEEGARLAHIRRDTEVDKMSDHATDMIANYVDGPFNVARIVNIGTALARSLDTTD